MPARTAYAKVYFYAASLGVFRQLGEAVEPVAIKRKDDDYPAALPAYLSDERAADLRFIIPEAVMKTPGWRAVVVFGDDKDATAVLVGAKGGLQSLGSIADYDFPEKAKCLAPSPVRKKEESPLIEERCPTGLKDYPRITLFARLPSGVKSARETNGVLCLSLLVDTLDEIRRSMNHKRVQGFHIGEMLRYADKNKLLIICWGTRHMWDGAKNWNELTKDEAKAADYRFDRVSAAWAGGINRICERYRIAPKDFLIWGYSDSAQYGHRLVLRKPQYFRAAYFHIPSSFDEPTPEAASVLWCLTAGEADGGYENSMKFVQQCRKRGYRMIFKAVPYLGHRDHVPARVLGMQTWDYARALPDDPKLREERIAADRAAAPFFCDYLNQVMEPADKSDWMPKNLKFPLATPLLAQAWVMNPDNPAPDPSPPASATGAAEDDDAAPKAPPPEVAPKFELADTAGVRAAEDPWADYIAAAGVAKKMRAMGVAWDEPKAPSIPVPESRREAVRGLCADAEKAYAAEVAMAAAMKKSGRNWREPSRPALLVARDAGRLDGPAAKPVPPPAPAAQPAPKAQDNPPGAGEVDPDNTVFGRRPSQIPAPPPAP